MKYTDVLQRSIGETIVINNGEERVLLAVEDDFVVLEGGNSQMKIIDFVPVAHIVKVIRAEYAATGTASTSFDLTVSGGDARRAGAH